MECRDIREQISAYVDGELAEAEAETVRGHLEACPACRALASRMRAVGVGVERIEAPLSASFREELFARLEREDLLPERRSLFAFSWWRWLAVPAAAAAAVALVLLTQGPPKGPGLPAPGETRVAVGTAPTAQSGAASGHVPGSPAGGPAETEAPPRPVGQAPAAGQVPSRGTAALPAAPLTDEEREILAYLEILENPQIIEEPSPLEDPDLSLRLSPTAEKG